MSTTVTAMTFEVSSTESFQQALTQARPGDTIQLASGNYGEVRITPSDLDQGGHGFDSPVTITSQDPDNPAVFTGLTLGGVANLTLDGLAFEHTPEAGDRVNDPVLSIRRSGESEPENITVMNSRFVGEPVADVIGGDPNDPSDVVAHGGVVAGSYTGMAIVVRDADNIVVDNNEITGFFRGISIERVSDIDIEHNYLHNLRSDGITVGEVQNITIESNVIRDLLPWRHEDARSNGDHPDLIQLWTTNSETASTGIVIRDNALIQSETSGDFFTQGIMMRNPKAQQDRTGTDFFYRDVEIEGNLIYNSHINSMVLGESTGLVVSNNILIQNTDDGVREVTTPIIAVAERSTDVTVTGNTAPALSWEYSTISNKVSLSDGHSLGWVVADNVFTELQQGPDGQVAVGPDGIVINYNAFLSGLDDVLLQVRSPELPSMGAAQVLDGNIERLEHDDGRIDMRFFDDTGDLVRQVSHDSSDAARWSTRTETVDPANAQSTVVYQMTDGAQRIEVYDSQGRLRETTQIDLDDTERWETRDERFDTNGQRVEREIMWDSGSFDTQEFDSGQMVRRTVEDWGDNTSWETFVREFNESDTLVFSNWQMDDGTERTVRNDSDGNLLSEHRIDHADVAPFVEELKIHAADGSWTTQRWLDSGDITVEQYAADGTLLNEQSVGANTAQATSLPSTVDDPIEVMIPPTPILDDLG